ncbi:MAG: BlaI/MecI/CopY family transcriptional regulator [Chthoniobacter sp.]|uniref:BlaI/MecI/CopY family transcriptional regulator n=1 Tax=Chthoniobacter sp. TaxID=2510640 RepID=UPI0032A61186
MPIKISPAEWEVLNVVWERAPVTAPEVFQALTGDQDWHSKTVNTFLTRLVEKGILDARRDGKVNVYTPLLSREECVREESATFLQRVFRGALAPMMLHFVENAELTDEDIAELQRALKQRSKKGPK